MGTEVTDSWQDTQGAGAVRGDAVLSIQNTKQKRSLGFYCEGRRTASVDITLI